VLQESALDHFMRGGVDNAALATQRFDNANTFLILDRWHSAIPAGWTVRGALLFTSEAHLERAVARGIPDNVRAVIYDNESWDKTPPAERNDPCAASRRFAEVAHRHGLVYIAAPGIGLRNIGSDRFFLADAVGADIIVAQIQGAESQPREYHRLLARSVAAATRVHPGIPVLGETSSNPARVCPGDVLGNCTANDVARVSSDIAANNAGSSGSLLWAYNSYDVGDRSGHAWTARSEHLEDAILASA
jgi:hypothetical protein